MAKGFDWIEGIYVIEPHATTTYQFWWPGGGEAKEYFDVWIAPTSAKDAKGNTVPPTTQLRLVERERQMFRIFDEKSKQTRYELWITVENETDFQVSFTGNHIRIHG
jgi:hypothetical protein